MAVSPSGRTAPAPQAPGDAVVALAASIVVPVHNGSGLTARCLEAVAAAAAAAAAVQPAEVIVVDDASTDGTADYLAGTSGITVLRNETNLGFLDSANRGAEIASGRHLVFLNNDTVVRSGWLEALLDAAESGPDVGAVGSRLDCSDGRLQEAGGIVWSDGTAWNRGRGRDPEAPEYSYRTEVDYCSGAALLVRRDLFQLLGGFDRRFAPGYYEDTDLCFALRARGYRVLYEPRSVVMHEEGGSFGTDVLARSTGGHAKSGQAVNRHVFAAKWARELRRQWPPGTAQGLLGGRIDGRPRVLIVDLKVPSSDRDSGSLRMEWILRLLRELDCHVTHFPWHRHGTQPYTGVLQRIGVEIFHGDTTFERFCRERAGLYDLVLLSRPEVAASAIDEARRSFPSARLVFDTVDIHFLRQQRRLGVDGVKAPAESDVEVNAQRHLELTLARRCDLTATVTEEEARLLESEVAGVRTVVLPNVHETRLLEPPGFEERHDLLFIGSFEHPPNIDAVLWFVDEVMPLITAKLDVALSLIGSGAPPEILALDGPLVSVRGHVHDVTGHFDRARVFVSPLRYGAGMKGKNGQALALGLPIVTTSTGAEGMHLVDGRDALIRDDAAGFAAAVTTLYGDQQLWERLSCSGRATVGERFSPQTMRARLAALIRPGP